MEQICERYIHLLPPFSFTLQFSNDQKCGTHVLAHGELSSNTVGIGCVSYWSMQLETKQNFISPSMNRKVSLCSKLFRPFFPEPLKVKIVKSCPEWYLFIPFIMILKLHWFSFNLDHFYSKTQSSIVYILWHIFYYIVIFMD